MQVILQGSLRHFPAAELLTFLLHRSQSGTLDLEHAGRRTRILFEQDQIVWAESNKVGEATDAIIDAMEWPAGTFTVLDSLSLPVNAQRLALTLPAILEEVKKRAEGYRDSTMFRVIENPGQQQVSLSGEQFKILFRLATGRTLAELIADLQFDRKKLVEELQKLEDLGLVESSGKEKKTAETMPPARAPQAPPAAEPPAAPAPPAPAPPALAPPAPAPLPPPPAAAAPPPPAAPNPFAPKTGPIPVQEDAEATRIERDLISRNTVNRLKSPERKNTLVGSLTPDDRPDATYPLFDAECVIGRAPDCTISIQDGSISSRHARVSRSSEGFSIEDLGSRNGTFVNGEKVDKPRLLTDGDVVRLGKIVMTFSVAQEIVAEPKTQMMNLE